MPFFKSKFERAINKGLKPGQSLHQAIRPFIFDLKISTKGDALALVRALSSIREEGDKSSDDWNAVGHLVVFLEEADVSQEAIREVLATDGTRELIRIAHIVCNAPGVKDRDFLLTLILRVLALQQTEAGTKCVIEFALYGACSGSSAWRRIFEAFHEIEHPYARLVVDMLSAALPERSIAAGFLGLCNALVLKNETFRHPFNTASGFACLKTLLAHNGYPVIEAAGLKQIDDQYAAPLLNDAINLRIIHFSPEAARVAANRGMPEGIVALQKFCLDLVQSEFAQKHLAELGREDAIPVEASSPSFKARAAFALKMAPDDYYERTATIEVIANRTWTWPGEVEPQELILLQFREATEDSFEPNEQIGFNGRARDSFYDDTMNQWNPDDCFARHIGAEIRYKFSEYEPTPPIDIPSDWTRGALEIVHNWCVRRFSSIVKYPPQEGYVPEVIAVAAVLNGQRGFAVFDGPRSEWYDQSHFPDNFIASDVLDIHVGRVLLGLPHRIMNSLNTQRPFTDEFVVQTYETWLDDLEAGHSQRLKMLLFNGNNLRPNSLSKHFDRYIDAASRLTRRTRSELILTAFQRVLSVAVALPDEEARSAFGGGSLLTTHLGAFISELAPQDFEKARAIIARITPLMDQYYSRRALAVAATKGQLISLARKNFEKEMSDDEYYKPIEVAEVWFSDGEKQKASEYLIHQILAAKRHWKTYCGSCRLVLWDKIDRSREAAAVHRRLSGPEAENDFRKRRIPKFLLE